VDASCRPRDERNGGGLVALAEDAQRAMAAFDTEVLDVGGARLAHSQSVQPEKHRQGGVGAVVLLGSEQEHAGAGSGRVLARSSRTKSSLGISIVVVVVSIVVIAVPPLDGRTSQPRLAQPAL